MRKVHTDSKFITEYLSWCRLPSGNKLIVEVRVQIGTLLWNQMNVYNLLYNLASPFVPNDI